MTIAEDNRENVRKRLQAAIARAEAGRKDRVTLLAELAKQRGTADVDYYDSSDVVVMVNGVRAAGRGADSPVRGVGGSGLVEGDEGRA